MDADVCGCFLSVIRGSISDCGCCGLQTEKRQRAAAVQNLAEFFELVVVFFFKEPCLRLLFWRRSCENRVKTGKSSMGDVLLAAQ